MTLTYEDTDKKMTAWQQCLHANSRDIFLNTERSPSLIGRIAFPADIWQGAELLKEVWRGKLLVHCQNHSDSVFLWASKMRRFIQYAVQSCRMQAR